MKNSTKLLFLVGIIILLLGGGCVVFIPTAPTPGPGPGGTGGGTTTASTIYIYSSDGVHGNVSIDGAYVGTLSPYGTLDMHNISYGTHTLTLDTLPYTSYTINVTYDGQTISIDWYGNVQ